MAQIEAKKIKGQQWRDLLDEHGNGKIQPRYRYDECNDDDNRFLGRTIVHGPHTETGDLTNTGFLLNQTGQAEAGVDQIPT